jgi:dTDP-glucose 4,6-dehydratase
MNSVLVTGGAGFIGCNFVRLLLAESGPSGEPYQVVVLDKLTYAGHRESLAEVEGEPRYRFVHGDVADRELLRKLFAEHDFDAVVNFAAESHVDRSIEGPGDFLHTNVAGTFELLEAARAHLARDPARRERFRFLHVSTDEVYGTLGEDGQFSEETPYAPNSPYAASKAAADHFVRAWFHTYGLPTLLTNCSNNYGPFQFPEKLIPLMVLNAAEGKPLPVYGDGGNVRDWLHVEDHCRGILLVLQAGTPGGKYNLGGGNERTNLQVVAAICSALEHLRPAAGNPALRDKGLAAYDLLVRFVPDRPGHDRRYAIDASKVRRELGWAPRYRFEDGLVQTVGWYLANLDWCEAVQARGYRRERLGLLRA